MLIRLCAHYMENPSHIDKLICINGLPDEFFYRWNEKYKGNELIKPWEPDVEVNIPQSIRHLCKPVDLIKVFPPIEKGRDSVVDRFQAIGLKFDYMTEAGQTMWDRIERYLEQAVPRDKLVPKPVIVAPDQKAAFDPHEARRTSRGGLEYRKAEVPVVDLTPPAAPILAPVALTPAPVVQALNSEFKCECGKIFDKKRALAMHKLGAHRKEKAVA